MRLRNFPNPVETVAREWATKAIEDRAWKNLGDAPVGESNPFFVRSGDLAGVAKPRETRPPPHVWPRAAVEKICSDLAFELGLPVPPVLLWKATRKAHLPVRTLAVSLFPFVPPIVAWKDIEEAEDEEYAARLLPHFREPGSALVAFDSWVGNTDRKNSGNVVLKEEDEPPGLVRVAYIDFAASLQFGYSDRDPLVITPVDAYPDASQLDAKVLETTITKIERLPRTQISEVVDRVPGEYLSEGQKQRIVNGLLARQSTLKQTLIKFFGELAWAGKSETCG